MDMALSYHSTVPSPRYHPLVGYPTEATEDSAVALDEQQQHHVALPKLYGAPAYARPAPVVDETPRPFDPDDLPIEAIQTPEERELAASLPAHAYIAGGFGRSDAGSGADGALSLNPRPLSLRALAGRILGKADN